MTNSFRIRTLCLTKIAMNAKLGTFNNYVMDSVDYICKWFYMGEVWKFWHENESFSYTFFFFLHMGFFYKWKWNSTPAWTRLHTSISTVPSAPLKFYETNVHVKNFQTSNDYICEMSQTPLRFYFSYHPNKDFYYFYCKDWNWHNSLGQQYRKKYHRLLLIYPSKNSHKRKQTNKTPIF